MENLTVITSSLFRRIGATLLSAKARLSGRGFVCESLQGTAWIGVCINSDLTLSCGCRDLDGSGHFGDLHDTSFEDAFFGPTAQAFREKLAAGRIPTPNCTRCQQRHSVSKREAQRLLDSVALPASVMVENTSVCNLHCLSCARDRVKHMRKRRTMSLDDVRSVARDLEQIGVERITFHNLGEPFLSKRLLEELTIIREHNPHVEMEVSTNGMLIDTDQKREAALLFDRVHVSLDGVDQAMASRYQRGIDFDRVLQNVEDLVEYRDKRNVARPRIIWKYLLFRWSEGRPHQLRAIDLARKVGVDELWFEKTVSPLFGLPWRSHLGFYKDIGVDCGYARHLVFREENAAPQLSEPGGSEA